MATLEKIRSKSVLLIVVIGLALLAFIIGDALTNSRNLFGDHTTVAKVGGHKIDYMEYQRKREELNNQLEQARHQNPAQYAGFDVQMLPQMAIDQLVAEKLLDEAVSKSGMKVSGDLLRFYVLDNPVNREGLSNILQQLNSMGVSASTPAQAYEIIFNPKRNGLTDAQMAPFQRAWIAMEEETRQMVMRNSYQRLVYGTVKANDLDKKALYNDYVNTSDITYAYKPFGALDEKEYPVSDADLRKEYDNVKYMFKVNEPTKEVAFIAVTVMPSAADRQAASELARKTVASMTDTTDNAARSLRKEGVVVDRKELRASDIRSNAMKEYLATASRDSVKLISETINGFTAVKLGRRYTSADSIQLNLVQVVGDKLPARVMARLNAGLDIDSIATAFPADSVMAQKDQWIPLFSAEGPTNALTDAQLDSLRMAGSAYIALMESPQGSVLAKVVKQTAPVEIYEYEEISYDLKPSTKTINDERAKLEKFLAENNTAKKFRENAAKDGYNVQDFSLTQSSAAVPRMMGMQSYYPDSRQVVRWVMMDGKPGEVSNIYESKDAQRPALYVVAVDAEYEDYAPLASSEVKNFVTDKVRRNKAGEKLTKEYGAKASSVASVATAMGVEPQTNAQFRFGRNGAVRDAKVMGRIKGQKADKRVYVVAGDDGMYAFTVNGNAVDKFPFNDQSYEQQYMQMINPDFQGMLKGSKEVKNNAYKFEAGE